MIEPHGAESRPSAPAPRRRPRLLSALALVVGVVIVSGAVAAGVTIGLLRQSRSASQDLNLGGLVPFSDESTVIGVTQRSLPALASVIVDQQGLAVAAGSAFAVRGDGYLVTNTTVLANAVGLSVLLAKDGKRHDARVIDFDCTTGVAVLKVDQISGLSTLGWGDSASLRAGQTVLAMGGPVPPTAAASRGVVSALHRAIQVPAPLDPARNDEYDDSILTDARVDPAGAGGPMLNTGGQVVGILVVPPAAGQAPFALASNDVQASVDQIISTGQLLVPSLATSSTELSPEEAALRGLVAGNLLRSVTPGGPAALAGLRPGDVITQLDDVKVDPGHPLTQLLRTRFKAAQRVTVTYTRAGTSSQVQLTLRGEHPTCS